MAYVELRPVRKNLSYTVNYVVDSKKTTANALEDVMGEARNVDKTEKELFVSALNCTIDTATEEFFLVQKQFDKQGQGIIAHHGWQSFHENENVDPSLVHKIGVELAENYFGDRFQVVVTTHLNKAHLHNHFVVNSVSFKDGKKYYSNKESLKKFRKASDELCLKYGLSIIENPKRYGKGKPLYRAETEGHMTWRGLIKKDIDEAIKTSIDVKGFVKDMQKRGYLFKQGKHFAISPPKYEKNGSRAFIRLRSLKDEDYTLEGIQRRLAHNHMKNYGFSPVKRERKTRKKVYTKRKIPHYMAVYYRYMYKLGLLKRKPRRVNYYRMRKGQQEAVKLSEKIRYIKEHEIFDETDRAVKIAALKLNIKTLEGERKCLYNKKYRGQPVDLEQLNILTKYLQDQKKELRICESIAVKPYLSKEKEEIKIAPKEEQNETQKKKEGKEHECRSGSR